MKKENRKNIFLKICSQYKKRTFLDNKSSIIFIILMSLSFFYIYKGNYDAKNSKYISKVWITELKYNKIKYSFELEGGYQFRSSKIITSKQSKQIMENPLLKVKYNYQKPKYNKLVGYHTISDKLTILSLCAIIILVLLSIFKPFITIESIMFVIVVWLSYFLITYYSHSYLTGVLVDIYFEALIPIIIPAIYFFGKKNRLKKFGIRTRAKIYKIEKYKDNHGIEYANILYSFKNPKSIYPVYGIVTLNSKNNLYSIGDKILVFYNKNNAEVHISELN